MLLPGSRAPELSGDGVNPNPVQLAAIARRALVARFSLKHGLPSDEALTLLALNAFDLEKAALEHEADLSYEEAATLDAAPRPATLEEFLGLAPLSAKSPLLPPEDKKLLKVDVHADGEGVLPNRQRLFGGICTPFCK